MHQISAVILLSLAASGAEITPLFGPQTKLQPATTIHTQDALITRIADRVRDRHARESMFRAYDHYLSFYWEERTVAIEIVDRVAKGGKEIVVNIKSLSPLNNPNFRCFFRGINTVAEYHHNVVCKKVGENRYTTTIRHNTSEGRAIQKGDRMAFEFSPFLLKPKRGRKNYYGTEMLYIVGKGIAPWRGVGKKLDSHPLPKKALLGGGTTLSYPYSDEPKMRFSQLATNAAPANAQPFMLGRRLHHTDFGNGEHSEKPNPVFTAHVGKAGPAYVARSCVGCHVNNGRSIPDARVGEAVRRAVIKVGSNKVGDPHPRLGTALQSQGKAAEPTVQYSLSRFIKGAYADGTRFTLRKFVYTWPDLQAGAYNSIRVAPQLVGMGLLEAIAEKDILALADPQDKDTDGISGRVSRVIDPEDGKTRLGRFGYRASQPRLRHQVAGALNGDMGVTSSIFPKLDGAKQSSSKPELDNRDLANLTRYVALLGVNARRDLDGPLTKRGESLFKSAGCAKCHTSTFRTSKYHPLAELRNQTIHPYTDLLLHDMGPGLKDFLGDKSATGSEWRTAPLWNIGLTKSISGKEAYLHDGRARNLAEAILWHGGEAHAARERFRKMPAADRKALVAFLKSL